MAVLREIGDREKALERAANLRAGLVTSAIYNVHRKKGARVLKPQDFVRGERRYMDLETAKKLGRQWAASINRTH